MAKTTGDDHDIVVQMFNVTVVKGNVPEKNFSTGEGGVFSGHSPLEGNLALFLVQALIIIALSKFLHLGLSRLRQPRVIAEVIGGICLGPSVLGLIPGFTDTIFPQPSLPFLALVSNIGLVLYLFLVGLELDPQAFFRDLRRSLVISAAGMVLPFGLGAAVSWGIYRNLLSDGTIPFTSFLLFTGCAMSITAFPVLARILAEFKLLTTPVGLMTITAAALNDATAWALLALIVSILNAGSMLTALYVFLVVVGYALLILVPFRLLFQKAYDRFFSKKSDMLTQFLVSAIFMLIFVSAWITDLIGIHAIFGAFLMGLAIPRSDGLPIHLTEKIEDVVNIVFLPLFFASSGLKTKVGLLNDGMTWLWLFLVILVACSGKIIGCALAAKAVGIPWRESWSIGILMNTKGYTISIYLYQTLFINCFRLVELIVLNIGLQANVINDRIFVIMVMMALVTTFITSPVISFVYPPRFHKRISPGGELEKAAEVPGVTPAPDEFERENLRHVRILVLVESMDSLGYFANFIRLLKGPDSAISEVEENGGGDSVTLNALRIVQTSERSSSIMAASQAAAAAEADPALKMAGFFGDFLNVPTRCFLTTSAQCEVSQAVNDVVAREDVNIVVIPYNQLGSVTLTQVGEIFRQAIVTTVILLDHRAHHDMKVRRVSVFFSAGILVPFVGGADDRRAVSLALRVHRSSGIRLRIFHLRPIETETAANKLDPTKKTRKQSAAPIKRQASRHQLEEDDKFIKDLKAQWKGSEQVTFATTEAGDPASLLVEECEQNRYDVILLGRSASVYEDIQESTQDIAGLDGFLDRKPSAIGSMRHKMSFSRQASRVSLKAAPISDSILGNMAEKLLDSNANCSLLVVFEPQLLN